MKIKIPHFKALFIKSSKTVSYELNLASECFHLEIILLSNFLSKRGNFNFFAYDPKDYELSCWGGFGRVLLRYFFKNHITIISNWFPNKYIVKPQEYKIDLFCSKVGGWGKKKDQRYAYLIFEWSPTYISLIALYFFL